MKLKFLIPLVLLPVCAAAAAQGMYKCKDAAGKVTYSGKECALIGLTSAGEVTGKASVTPALKTPPPSPARPAAPAQPPAPPQAASQSAPKDPAAPERRCFVVKTAKGNATRCNDTTEDEPAGK